MWTAPPPRSTTGPLNESLMLLVIGFGTFGAVPGPMVHSFTV
jgi:hypothetical protein